MGGYLEKAERWQRRQAAEGNLIDGHWVKQVVWETPRCIVFKDEQGRVWRRVHSWGMTWPITGTERK
jgi:hypothetical protein